MARCQEREERVSVPEVEDLPLIEVPASAATGRREMAIIVTGDGGWAELDKSVAAGLAAAGVPTVGLSSLRYFWTPRRPDAAAADLARIITHYSAAWHRDRVILIGYSFSADVLPFLVNRLAPAARAHVVDVPLLGLATTAAFEFHLAEWVGPSEGPESPTVPEGQCTYEAASVFTLRLVGVSLSVALSATLIFRGLSFSIPMLPGLWSSRR